VVPVAVALDQELLTALVHLEFLDRETPVEMAELTTPGLAAVEEALALVVKTLHQKMLVVLVETGFNLV
jgi:ethanolamine utilization microcompartment shell protein EutS